MIVVVKRCIWVCAGISDEESVKDVSCEVKAAERLKEVIALATLVAGCTCWGTTYDGVVGSR